MIKFTQARRDWKDIDFAQQMMRAGADGYKSIHHQEDWDDYVVLSTATSKEFKENYTVQDLNNIFEKLESVGEKNTEEFTLISGEKVLLYWEIDRYSGYPKSGYQD
jgi:hypothetical protein